MQTDRTEGPNPSGLCMCGCGQPVPLAHKTRTELGWVKGKPIRFLKAHHSRRLLEQPVEDRLLRRRVIVDGCWEWPGAQSGDGYGMISVGASGRQGVHRMAHELWIGPIPPGHEIDHLCRNIRCYNPAHLEAVSREENYRRGLLYKIDRSATHCPNGHPYDQHAVVSPGGRRRHCSVCMDALKRSLEREHGRPTFSEREAA